MLANRSRDTSPELAVRRDVHARGLRYRVCERPIPALRRTADLVFRRVRVAVFIDGCFWHGCPEHSVAPRAHADYWLLKLQRTRQRDAEIDGVLTAAGWTSIRIWEHEDPGTASDKICSVVRAHRHAHGSP